MTVVKRRRLSEVFDLIEAHHPNAFYAVDELQSASDGIFPERKSALIPILPSALKAFHHCARGSGTNEREVGVEKH